MGEIEEEAGRLRPTESLRKAMKTPCRKANRNRREMDLRAYLPNNKGSVLCN